MFVIAYDMLTQARIARRRARTCAAARRSRSPRAPRSPTTRRRSAPSPASLIGRRAAGARRRRHDRRRARHRDGRRRLHCCSASSWPKRWIGAPAGGDDRCAASRCTTRSSRRSWALATLAGVDLPGAVWLLAFGPVPTSVVSFSQVYGYSPRDGGDRPRDQHRGGDRAAAALAHARRLMNPREHAAPPRSRRAAAIAQLTAIEVRGLSSSNMSLNGPARQSAAERIAVDDVVVAVRLEQHEHDPGEQDQRDRRAGQLDRARQRCPRRFHVHRLHRMASHPMPGRRFLVALGGVELDRDLLEDVQALLGAGLHAGAR